MKASRERNPPISVVLDLVGALNLIAGALLILSNNREGILAGRNWRFGAGRGRGFHRARRHRSFSRSRESTARTVTEPTSGER
jgi:hypothetical protein